jgi:ATP-dependent exoDNAse (exonuclease V) alpha subunit
VHHVAKDKITLRCDEGELMEFTPNENSPIGLYEKEDIQIGVGDRIRTNMNDKALGTVNGKMWDVSAIGADAITLKNENSEISVPIVKGLGVFLQHGYTSTAYSAQGLTADSVMLDINTNSITSNQASFYVGISRVKSNLKIFANADTGEITKAVARELKKFAALELRNPYLEAKLLDEKIAIVTAKRDKGEGDDLSHAKVPNGAKSLARNIVGVKSVAKTGKARVNRMAK